METRLQQLFQGLRLCGAAMIIAAAGTFLVQSWDQVGDVRRYLCLLAMTGALPGLAYLCGIRLRESRSARALLITLLALVPIHAGVLGGFVFSQFGAVHQATTSVAQWVAPNRIAAILLVFGAVAVLVPFIWSAFRVLGREHARVLTATSLFAHGLLLIPDRSALAAILVVIPILGAATWCGLRVKPKTAEAKVAVGSLVAPAILVVARQVLFYDVSWAFWGTVLGACAVALFALGENTGDRTLSRFTVVPTLLSVGFLWADAKLSVSVGEWFLVYGLLTALPLLAFAWKSRSSRSFFIATATIVNATLAGLVVLFASSPWASFEAIALGLGLASYGFLLRRRLALYSGIALTAPGFITEVAHAIEVFRPSGWLALVIFGLGLVVLTAWLEHRARQVAPPEAR
ncbi:MAG: hypothetical protein OEM15_17125 [Myxococcales bacterium]|nr:hypothetical protein [Myxococcales bacterium]MDH3484118.1 hypothetical protein [Myxococcales bacterium]